MKRPCMSFLAGVALLFLAGRAAGQTGQKTTHLGGNPSNMIQLIAEADASGDNLFELVHPDGSPNTLWHSIPEGYVLVVTDMNITLNAANSAAGQLSGCLISTKQGSTGSTKRFCYAFDFPSHPDSPWGWSQHLTLTTGVVFSDVPGNIIDGPMVATHGSQPSTVLVYGYLVQDK